MLRRILLCNVRGIEPVDFDLPSGTKWANMNLGASGTTDGGLYFQWGDISGYTASQVGSGSGKKYFSWGDYKYCDGSQFNMTKYNASDKKMVLDLSDDAAATIMGGNWRIPTNEEFNEFLSAVTTAYTSSYQGSGVKGVLCTHKTDSTKKIFFPIFGMAYNGNIGGTSASEYWSRNLSNDSTNYAYSTRFSSSIPQRDVSELRYYGLFIRPVLPPN